MSNTRNGASKIATHIGKKFIKDIGYWFLVNYSTIIYHYFVDMLIDMGFNMNNLFNSIPDSFTIIFMNWKKFIVIISFS